ncbi:MAG TPA: Rap1a/Tai family immunity protein [Rudaea sp.]|jgi:hypothetical protein
MLNIIATMGILLAAVDPATELNDGQSLLRWLEEKPETPDHIVIAGAAMGFVAGVASTMQLMKIICPPAGTTRGQNIAIVVKYLKEHPKSWRLSSTFLTMQALDEAWACPKPSI